MLVLCRIICKLRRSSSIIRHMVIMIGGDEVMKRIVLLVAVLVGVALLTVGCSNAKEEISNVELQEVIMIKEEIYTPINNTLSIDYSNLDEDIFGDLSQEEIDNLFMDIANEIYEDEDYESNLNSIIENVFSQYGLDISSKIDDVMSKLKISKPNSK